MKPYDLQNSFDISDNIVVPESENHESVISETSIPRPIVPLIFRMLTSVKFNDNSWIEGDEINDV